MNVPAGNDIFFEVQYIINVKMAVRGLIGVYKNENCCRY